MYRLLDKKQPRSNQTRTAFLIQTAFILLYCYDQILPVISRTAYPVIPLLRRVLLKHPQNHTSGRCSHNHRSQIHKGTSNGGKDEDTSMRRPEGYSQMPWKALLQSQNL